MREYLSIARRIALGCLTEAGLIVVLILGPWLGPTEGATGRPAARDINRVVAGPRPSWCIRLLDVREIGSVVTWTGSDEAGHPRIHERKARDAHTFWAFSLEATCKGVPQGGAPESLNKNWLCLEYEGRQTREVAGFYSLGFLDSSEEATLASSHPVGDMATRTRYVFHGPKDLPQRRPRLCFLDYPPAEISPIGAMITGSRPSWSIRLLSICELGPVVSWTGTGEDDKPMIYEFRARDEAHTYWALSFEIKHTPADGSGASSRLPLAWFEVACREPGGRQQMPMAVGFWDEREGATPVHEYTVGEDFKRTRYVFHGPKDLLRKELRFRLMDYPEVEVPPALITDTSQEERR